MVTGTPGNGGILPSGREAKGRAVPSARAQEAKRLSSRHSRGKLLLELLGWVESEVIKGDGTGKEGISRVSAGMKPLLTCEQPQARHAVSIPHPPSLGSSRGNSFPGGKGLVASGIMELLGSVSRSRQQSRTEQPNGFVNPLPLISSTAPFANTALISIQRAPRRTLEKEDVQKERSQG